jgi:hypothetical protein
VAPLRTINDAFFDFLDTAGVRHFARRGETVDIPEGEDLTRGDKWGAFTKEVGEEPPPPPDTHVTRPQLGWSATEFDRYTDAAHISEVEDHISSTPDLDRAPLALLILESENRKKNPRPKLVSYLAEVTGTAEAGANAGAGDEAPTDIVPGTAGEDTLIDEGVKIEEPPGDETPVTPQEGAGEPVVDGEVTRGAPDGGEDLGEYVSTNTIEAVLERAGSDPELAKALREAEESRGEKARKGAIEGLTKIENPEG